MELCTLIPARADGTVVVRLPLGGGKQMPYLFSGEPMSCEVEDEGHAIKLLATGNFLSREDYEEEMDLQRRVSERNARMRATAQLELAKASASGEFTPELGEGAANPADEVEAVDPNSQPQEAGTRPTGRVRKAQK